MPLDISEGRTHVEELGDAPLSLDWLKAESGTKDRLNTKPYAEPQAMIVQVGGCGGHHYRCRKNNAQ